jgi:heme exporter protein A
MQIADERAPVRLELERLELRYGRRQVLADLSLTLRAGEVLVVAGDNGSGKSSLLRVLAGLQRPNAGLATYYMDEQPLPALRAAPLVGWVAPDLMLYRDLTAAENLRFFAQVRGLALDAAALASLLAEVDLDGRGDDLLASYSSGMAQRLRYAYALLHRPPVLLLDEPTITLDEGGAELVARVIAHQRRRGLAVIATNDAREQRFGDYLLTLGVRKD